MSRQPVVMVKPSFVKDTDISQRGPSPTIIFCFNNHSTAERFLKIQIFKARQLLYPAHAPSKASLFSTASSTPPTFHLMTTLNSLFSTWKSDSLISLLWLQLRTATPQSLGRTYDTVAYMLWNSHKSCQINTFQNAKTGSRPLKNGNCALLLCSLCYCEQTSYYNSIFLNDVILIHYLF